MPKPKLINIIQFTTRLNVGGVTAHISDLSSGLKLRGVNCIIVSGIVDSSFESDMSYLPQSFGINIIFLNNLKRNNSLFSDLKSVFSFYIILKTYKPELVNTHTSKAGLVGRIAVFLYNVKFRPKIKIVHTFHGHVFTGYFSSLKSLIFLYIERILAFVTDKIIVLSKSQFNDIYKVFKVGNINQYHIIGLGLSVSDQIPSPENKGLRGLYGIPDNASVFAIVGRVTPIKNHSLFIKSAIDYFDNSHNKMDTFFLVIGDGDQEYVMQLKEMARGYPNILFIGLIKNKTSIFNAIDYLVITSSNEGTPFVAIEAFAFKKLVITTKVGGLPDLIGQSERGIYINPIPSEISKVFNSVINSNNILYIDNAREYYLNNFTINKMVNNTLHLYESIL